jgi:hypothetical protein
MRSRVHSHSTPVVRARTSTSDVEKSNSQLLAQISPIEIVCLPTANIPYSFISTRKYEYQPGTVLLSTDGMKALSGRDSQVSDA